MRAILDVFPEVKDRVEEVAKQQGMTKKNAASTLLDWACGKVESGDLQLAPPDRKFNVVVPGKESE